MRVILFIAAHVAALIVALPSAAQSFDYWTVGETDQKEVLFAATTNDSGNLLGQFCAQTLGGCAWLIGMKTACKEGEIHPVLVNSDAGATPISVECSSGRLESGLYRYLIKDFETIDDIVRDGVRIGFAIPLQSDRFRVIRFELRGSKQAIAYMRSVADDESETPLTSIGTRDLDL